MNVGWSWHKVVIFGELSMSLIAELPVLSPVKVLHNIQILTNPLEVGAGLQELYQMLRIYKQ